MCAVLWCAVLCAQTSREAALRKSEARAEAQRNEQDALGVLLTEREAGVLDKEQALQAATRYAYLETVFEQRTNKQRQAEHNSLLPVAAATMYHVSGLCMCSNLAHVLV